MDDDQCIAMAVLHGAEFWQGISKQWFVDARDENPYTSNKADRLHMQRTGRGHFTSRAEAARVYCEAYGLL